MTSRDLIAHFHPHRRLNHLSWRGTTVAAYTYFGAGGIAVVDYTQPDVRLNLAFNNLSVGNPADGLDCFGRVKDMRWQEYVGAVSLLERLEYGYDLASNRTYRKYHTTDGGDFSEVYGYDRAHGLGSCRGIPIAAMRSSPRSEYDPPRKQRPASSG